MLAYVLRKLLYMPFILLGVVGITFMLFTISTRPEALAKIQLGEKSTARQQYQWLESKGYISWTERGMAKMKAMEAGALPTRTTQLFNAALLAEFAADRDRLEAEMKELQAREQDDETKAAKAVLEDRIFKNKTLISGTLKSATTTFLIEKLTLATYGKASALAAQEGAVAEAKAALDEAEKKKEGIDEAKTAFEKARKQFDDANAETPGALQKLKDAKAEAAKKYTTIEDVEADLRYTSRFTMFLHYVADLLRLDFGDTRSGRPVAEVLWKGMGPSLALALPAFLLSELIALFFGLLAAMYRKTPMDATLVISSIVLMSVNGIAMIMFGQKMLAADWNYFPISGFASGFGMVRYLMLPALLYVVLSYGEHVRFNRIIMLDEVGQDYVRTARAKGLNENTVLFKHVFRNSLIPLITRWVVAVPALYTGSLILESFFGIPGLGYLTVDAISNSDGNIIRAVVVIGAVSFMLANLLSDVLYALVDPRIRLG
ncbi:MAG: ABC transporter permease subunit [Planctomycetes bacterium]|nr:ABC transporter permease subunit [Planctomycetota bacterium]